jgi:hypothetical protein
LYKNLLHQVLNVVYCNSNDSQNATTAAILTPESSTDVSPVFGKKTTAGIVAVGSGADVAVVLIAVGLGRSCVGVAKGEGMGVALVITVAGHAVGGIGIEVTVGGIAVSGATVGGGLIGVASTQPGNRAITRIANNRNRFIVPSVVKKAPAQGGHFWQPLQRAGSVNRCGLFVFADTETRFDCTDDHQQRSSYRNPKNPFPYLSTHT